MSAVDLLAALAAQPAGRPALCDATRRLTHGALRERVAARADALRAQGTRVLASQLDNGIDWIVADLAALQAGVVHVPLPLFFSDAQRAHALRASGADALLAHDASGHCTLARFTPDGGIAMHPGTAKITFTSGTTGTPKGVCLPAATMFTVARGLAEALAPLRIERHLCALPMPVLLENLAGVYAPLLAGACVVVRPLADVGLEGSSRFDPARLDAAVRSAQAHSVIVLPQMLRSWTAWRSARVSQATSLRFVAVGGAPVGAANLARARALGLPAYEGYGLSEGASVQTLNLPQADCPGSVGRVLPHARVRIAPSGEIEVAGSVMLGYLGGAPAPAWWPSGDLGTLDGDGFVHVRGRRNDTIVTSFGRNVAPEWVETALQSQPAVAQAAVFGNDAPALTAVLWPAGADTPDAALARAVEEANATLPDYARVAHWRRARVPFDAASAMATPNGRPRRSAIAAAHGLAAPGPSPMTPMTTTFHERLLADTVAERAALQAVPIVRDALRGKVSLASYVAFLSQAFHHVRHTVPLLAACRDALPPRLAWLAPALDEYIAEESGHDDWILDDLAACGVAPDTVRQQGPAPATARMVAYAYDVIARGNPVAFLGMVHVLEGTSVALALAAAERIQTALGLPDTAFSYLRSHGTLDREHVAHFAVLVDRIDDAADRASLLDAARTFYRLYADVFRSLPSPAADARGNRSAIA